MVLLVTRYVLKTERKKRGNKIRKRNTSQHFEENMISKKKRNIKAQFLSRMGSIERNLGDGSINQDLQVLKALKKVDYLTLKMIMTDLKI